jgi:hypothetical protein
MSTTSGVSSSSDVGYAMQLAQTSQLKRHLHHLDTAIQKGHLSSAISILTALAKAYPEYAISADDSTASTGDPINKGFQEVAKALDENDAGAARTAWAQLKSDLAKAGVSDITNGKAATAKLLADTKSSIDQAIIGKMFGVGSKEIASFATLSGISGDTSSDPVSTAIAKWLSYEADGKTSDATDKTTGSNLDTEA